MTDDMQELMLDLLCKKAIYGLSGEEEKQLAELQKLHGGKELEPESFEATVAMLSLAGADENAQLPANLQSRILAESERYFDHLEAANPDGATAPAVVPAAAESGGYSLATWLGWAVAAAACIALALNVYTTRNEGPQIVQVPVPAPSPAQLTPEQKREQLIRNASDLARGSFGAGNMKELTPAGDVVWSDERQEGYMRLRGLPKNDPSRETYQLWIFDETQSEKTPIDGGTFDVTEEGEVVIPIDAKLEPHNTKAFAITVEKPGGVVVSSREKIAALAKRET